MTRPETQRELRAAIERGATMRLVPLANGASLLVVDDPPTPDPRTAHGPAWSAGTPHTDEEAAVILGQVEPRHALRERMHHRMQRTLGNVVLEPSPRVTPGEPMPAATMPRAQWRATWRAAEVPALCELRERCEASGALPVMAVRDDVVRSDGVWDRHAGWWLAARESEGGTVDDVLQVGLSLRGPSCWTVPGRLHLPDDAVPVERRDHGGPYDEERGWCAELAAQT